MKNHRLCLNTILPLSLMMFIGCSKGAVTVENVGNLKLNTNPTSDVLNPRQNNEESKTLNVYFLRGQLVQNRVSAFTGIGFSPENSRVTTAMTFSFGNLDPKKNIRPLASWKSGALYVAHQAGSRDSLILMNRRTLEKLPILSGLSPVVSLDASEDQRWLATTDFNGKVSLYDLSSKKNQLLSFDNEIATSVKFAASRFLLITTRTAEASNALFNTRIIEMGRSLNPIKIIESNEVDIDADGKYLAAVLDSGTHFEIQVVSLERGTNQSVEIPAQVRPFGLKWSPSNQLAFMTKSGDLEYALYIYDHNLGDKPISVTTFSSNLDSFENFICPVWSGETLYLSLMDAGSAVIGRISKNTDGGWTQTVFARPTRDSDAYLCPLKPSN